MAGHWALAQPHRLWRSYSDHLNRGLCERWFPNGEVGRALKTDLFDEATSGVGMYALLATRARTAIGIDVSRLTVATARARQPMHALCADVRKLPFADQSFDLVLSNSTLDHFDSLDETAVALADLRRVLKIGGCLVLTLDNLANPAVALRNAMPWRWLERLRVVPYSFGATCGPRRLQHLAADVGLEQVEFGAMMHCPRLPAVIAAGLLDRLDSRRLSGLFLRSLVWWEHLARWPTRYRTGYFLTLKATRRDGSDARR